MIVVGGIAFIISLIALILFIANNAPPIAMLGAAIVIALSFGFGMAVFLEVRKPRISDAYDAEQVAGTRVLAIIKPREEIMERSRRQADVEGPPLIDVISESYRSLYLHLAATEHRIPVVTVTGDEPVIVATVAANLAAASAYEARSTLLIDIDPTTCAVARVLRIPANPGLAGIISESVKWPEAIVSTTIGRDRPLDVLPSGMRGMGAINPRIAEHIRQDFDKMRRRYDLIVLTSPISYTQRGASNFMHSDDVVLCAHVGHTPLKDLRSSVESLRGAGMTVHGLVLWNDAIPIVQ